MEVKEAIEFLRLTRLESGCISERKDYDDIVELLQEGEKYRQMWEGLKKSYGGLNVMNYPIWDEMEILEQKYFPKEASQDEE